MWRWWSELWVELEQTLNNPKLQHTIGAMKYLPEFLLLWVVLFYSVGLAAGIWIIAKAASQAERLFALIAFLGFTSSIVATVGLFGALPPQPIATWRTIWAFCWIIFVTGFIASIIAAELAKKDRPSG